MITQGEGGSGSALALCTVNPADLKAVIDNIYSRLEALEGQISQIASQDINANQLSDIAENVGWVYGVTYLGVPGWTQTSAGTLIPPTGFTLSSLGLVMSDGSPYQAVTMDSDGALQFGFDSDGQVAGTLPTNWNTGTPTALDYARWEYNNYNGSVTDVRGSSISLSSSSTSPNVEFVASVSAGLYYASVHGNIWKIGASYAGCRVDLVASTDSYPSDPVDEAYSFTNRNEVASAHASMSRSVYFSSSGTITGRVIGGGGYTVGTCKLNIVRLSG